MTLDAKNDTIIASYLWDNGDTVQTRSITDASKYWVRIVTPNCGTKTDSVTFIERTSPKAKLPGDTTFCDNILAQLWAGDSLNNELYRWNTGDSVNNIWINDTGTYKVVMSNECGSDSAAIVVDLLKTPSAILPDDSVFCNTVGLPIKVGIKNNDETYIFSNLNNQSAFSISDSVYINQAGFYGVIISNKCGSVADSIDIGMITTPKVSLPKDTTLCNAVSLYLEVGKFYNEENYQWNDNVAVNNRTVSQPGTYWVMAENKCGADADTMQISLVKSPTALLPIDSVFCNQVNYVLDAEIAEQSDYKWNTGSTLPQITATSDGGYKVTITNYCGSASDSIVLGLLTTPTVNLGEDKVFCGFIPITEFVVGKDNNNEDYIWSNGSLSDVNSVNSAGLHWVEISNKCGSASDSVRFTLSDFPIVDLGLDTTLCGNFKLVLDAGNPGMNYLWEPYGETTQKINATEQRTYKVTVSNQYGCKGSDEIEIDGGCLSFVNIPSAFSPNGDGLNDVFRPQLINYERFEMTIYNRWGEQLYYTTDADKGWDGSFEGKIVPNGVYLYRIGFITTEDLNWKNESGPVSVVR